MDRGILTITTYQKRENSSPGIERYLSEKYEYDGIKKGETNEKTRERTFLFHIENPLNKSGAYIVTYIKKETNGDYFENYVKIVRDKKLEIPAKVYLVLQKFGYEKIEEEEEDYSY